MPAQDRISRPPRASPPPKPEDQAAPRAAMIGRGSVSVPIERPRSGVRARMWGRSTIRTTMASAVPAWKLTALGLALVGVYVFAGPAPAALVLVGYLLAQVILGLVPRARLERRKP